VIRLPISGVEARWRPSTGHDDIALVDSVPGLAGALAYVAREVDHVGGLPLDAASLPIGDIDFLVLMRRREVRGDIFAAEGRCEHCGAAVDLRFNLSEYASHHRPRPPRGVAPAQEPGWWRLTRYEVAFRVPVAGDVLAVMTSKTPSAELLRRCVKGSATSRVARAAERAMAAIAPTLRADVAGSCPECQARVLLDVDARELCLTELRFLAACVYDDVNLIASVYHWSEGAILELTSSRRRRYADLIAGRSNDLALPAAERSVAWRPRLPGAAA